MTAEVVFTRNESVAGLIRQWIGRTTVSFDAALYRLNNPTLVGAVSQAAHQGVSVRVVVDRGKYEADSNTQRLLKDAGFPFRLLRGRRHESKMHHKFAMLDGGTVFTGSYNWTLESEEENYDHVVIVHDPQVLEAYRREFELLWREAISVNT